MMTTTHRDLDACVRFYLDLARGVVALHKLTDTSDEPRDRRALELQAELWFSANEH